MVGLPKPKNVSPASERIPPAIARVPITIIGANILGYELEKVPHLQYAKEIGLFSFDKDEIEIIGDIKKYHEKIDIPKETKEKYQSLNIIEKDAFSGISEIIKTFISCPKRITPYYI